MCKVGVGCRVGRGWYRVIGSQTPPPGSALAPVGGPQLPAHLDDLVGQAHTYAAANRSQRTKAAYASDWADFAGWAAEHGLVPLPADPAVVALYLTERADTLAVSTLERRMAAISVRHQNDGLDSPTQHAAVRAVLTGIRRTRGTASRQVSPASIGEIRRMIAHLPATTIGIRDKALLLVGFAGALRRSELVALNVGDLKDRDEGIRVTLRKSKTDQERKGREVALPYGTDPQTCPVTALRAWLDLAEITRGAIFRSVDRHGTISPTRLSDRAVANIVKRAAEGAGLDPAEFSGHSLRAGFATTAAAAGANERQIANQTGHTSMEVLRRYIRHGSLFTDNAATRLGL